MSSGGDCLRFDVSGRKQTSSHFKVKIKIQNDLTGHPSANLSVHEDVNITFNQSKKFFCALKCQKVDRHQKCPKIVKNYHGAPPPPALERAAADNLSKNSFFDRSSSSSFLSQSINEDVYKKECFSALKCERKAKAKITAPHPLHADLEKAAADNLSKLIF